LRRTMPPLKAALSGRVKVFGYAGPMTTAPHTPGAGVRKPPREETTGDERNCYEWDHSDATFYFTAAPKTRRHKNAPPLSKRVACAKLGPASRKRFLSDAARVSFGHGSLLS
jgi:hypothetical protein